MATRNIQHLVVAGLTLDVYSDATNAAAEVAVLFLLHGRTSSKEDVRAVAESLLDQIANKREKYSKSVPSLVVVAFDQRNHGSRLVDPVANSAWTKDANHNDRHAIDMYSIFVGTSRDVSFLIDFLPSYLYPSNEKTVLQWLVAGISLGGHSTWISLRSDPRIRIGIPIIGCADYLALVSARAQQSAIPFAPPYFPESLIQVVKATDPAWSNYQASDESNPFIGKKILALSGGADKLVPFSATEKFFEGLNVGTKGKKQAIVAPGVGHECTPDMVKQMADFIWGESLTI